MFLTWFVFFACALHLNLRVKCTSLRLAQVLAYIIYKIVRNDFRYWLPLAGVKGLLMSLIARVAVKVVTDFTGFLHARHPFEMGGFYWILNMVVTQISCLAVVGFKRSLTDVVANADTYFSDDDVLTMALILSSTWLVSVIVLIGFSNPAYRHTFYDNHTTHSYQKKLFDRGSDRTKMKILTKTHRHSWQHFEEEMKDWLERVWDELHTTKPTWFTHWVIATIPRDCVPGGNVDGLFEESKGGKSSRKSKIHGVGGGGGGGGGG